MPYSLDLAVVLKIDFGADTALAKMANVCPEDKLLELVIVNSSPILLNRPLVAFFLAPEKLWGSHANATRRGVNHK